MSPELVRSKKTDNLLLSKLKLEKNFLDKHLGNDK